MKKVIISIEGMSCASCAANIEKSLKKVQGVKSASVSLMTNKAVVDTEDFVSEGELRSAVSNAGSYKAASMVFEGSRTNNPEHMHHLKDKKEEHNHSGMIEGDEVFSWKKKMIWSWLITIPIALIMFSERVFGLILFGQNLMTIVLLILSFPVIFIIGFGTLKGGFRSFTRDY